MAFWNRKSKEAEPVKEKAKKLADDMGWPDLEEVGMASDIALQNILSNAVQVQAPVTATAEGSAMDSGIAGLLPNQSYGTINQRSLAYYVASSSFIGYFPCALIAQHWLVSKGCSFKAREAVKKWFEVVACDGSTLTPEQIKFINKKDIDYKLKKNLVEGESFNNVFGIRHILFKHKNPDFDYEKPFNPDSFGPGEYAGMSQIDPYWLIPEIDDKDLIDPSSIHYYEPTYWNLSGKRYHRSHFVILMGDEVADYLKPSYRYGGIGLVQRVYERVYAAETTANEGPQLAKTKRLVVQKVDAAEVQANLKKFIGNLNVFQKMRDNYGTRFIGKNDEIQQIDTSLTDLDTTIMTQYQLVCSTLGVPASKMLGTGHMGFSTGETDDDYWIQETEAVQENNMTLIIEAHYARLTPSALVPHGITSMIEPVWNPMKVMSENEKADVFVKVSTALTNLKNTGAIDAIDIQNYLVKEKDLGFEGLNDRESEIEKEDDFATDSYALDYVEKVGSQWYVFSETGKRLSKGYKDKQDANKRLGQIEYFKHND